MATWQYDFHLLPSAGVVSSYQTIPVVISQSDFDQEQWWERSPPPKEFESEISKLLPPLPTWNSDLKKWGFDDGNRIDTWRNKGTLSSIYVRVDVREVSLVFIATLMDMARRNGCLLRTQEGRVIPPSVAIVLSAIRGSKAFRFVQDPQAFLDALAKANESDMSGSTGTESG